MKWGIRRTAAQLGHLVGKGARKAKGTIDRRRADKRAEKLRKKPLSKLTESELNERIKRMQLEKQAFDLQRSLSSLDQTKVSAGKRFMASFGSKVLAPALIDSGKSALTSFLTKTFKNRLGVDVEDVSNAMDLLKQPLEALNDSQIKKLAKRAEDTSSIRKTLLGLKDNNDQDSDDGSNSLRSIANKPVDQRTDAETNKLSKRISNEKDIEKYIEQQRTKSVDSLTEDERIERAVSWMENGKKYWEV